MLAKALTNALAKTKTSDGNSKIFQERMVNLAERAQSIELGGFKKQVSCWTLILSFLLNEESYPDPYSVLLQFLWKFLLSRFTWVKGYLSVENK